MTCEHAGALDGVLSFAGMVLMKLKGNAPKSNRYPLYPSAGALDDVPHARDGSVRHADFRGQVASFVS